MKTKHIKKEINIIFKFIKYFYKIKKNIINNFFLRKVLFMFNLKKIIFYKKLISIKKKNISIISKTPKLSFLNLNFNKIYENKTEKNNKNKKYNIIKKYCLFFLKN